MNVSRTCLCIAILTLVAGPSALAQPPAPTLTQATQAAAAPTAFTADLDRLASSRSRRRSRIKRLPRMYGDSFTAGTIGFSGVIDAIPEEDVSGSSVSGSVTTPSCQVARIADNNSAVPQDRVYFLFQHFENAINLDLPGGLTRRSLDVYTLGIEKTFLDELGSVEVRLPFRSDVDASDQGGGLTSGTLQSVSLIGKVVLLENENSVFSGGLGLSFAMEDCGSQIDLGEDFAGIDDHAHRISPFLGHAMTLTDRCFINSFAQLTFALDDETLFASTPTEDFIDTYDPHDILALDLSVGYWLFRDESRFLSGVASLFELHYTTALQDDQSAFVSTPDSDFELDLQRFDTLNLTSGLHFAFGKSTARIAAVAPLRNDRFFDTEVHFSFNRNF